MKDSLFEWATEPLQSPAVALPQVVNKFDLLPVKERLASFQEVIGAMLHEAQSLDVVDDESNRQAVARAAAAKKKWKELEQARKDILAPHADFTATVNRLAKDCQGPLTEIERVLKVKISSYQAKIELERRKKEESARLAALELQKKIDAEAAANNIPAPQVVAPVMPAVSKVTRTEEGSASQVKTWSFDVVDPHAVPREYLVVDDKAIRQAVKNGVRTIPGVNIYEKTETRIRT